MLPKPNNQDDDLRSKYDYDVDRMINEGLAGGIVRPTYNRASLEEAREIRKNDEPFSIPEETRTDEE